MSEAMDDPEELKAAIEMLRAIYWREYGRGWREAVQRVKQILDSKAPDQEPQMASGKRGS